MNLRDFRRAGHAPPLVNAFLYFDVSFTVWLLPGSLTNAIVADFGLSDAQKGLMVAVPLLGGALALVYASRGWRGIFISAEGRAAAAPIAPRPLLAEAGNMV